MLPVLSAKKYVFTGRCCLLLDLAYTSMMKRRHGAVEKSIRHLTATTASIALNAGFKQSSPVIPREVFRRNILAFAIAGRQLTEIVTQMDK
jgi:hypothetical protein